MDITERGSLDAHPRTARKPEAVFPVAVKLQEAVRPLLQNLSKEYLEDHLTHLTSFHTRYYKSDYGRQSSEWLLQTIRDTIHEAGADEYGVKAEPFEHSWQQNSIIATIPGKSNKTIAIGAHQDSINLLLPSVFPAPGADDDGSGTVTILEAFRVLLQSEDVVQGNASNTIEFHWYAAEEAGLLGSQAIFSDYEKNGRDVAAMLQQDMTGFVQETIDAGEPESVGVVTDFVDPALTAFIKKVIEEVSALLDRHRIRCSRLISRKYCDIPWVETKCGYACSDHASASSAGYPSAFVIESAFEHSDHHIHGTQDLIKYLSFDHMIQHARMTLGLAYELGFTDFNKLQSEGEVGEL